MIKLNYAHICDYAFLSKENKINIMGEFEIIRIEPNKNIGNKIIYSFFVVTNYEVSLGKYIQQIIIKSKDDGEEIFNKETPLNGTSQEGKVGFIGNCGVIFPSHGEYIVEITLCDENSNDNRKTTILPLKVHEPRQRQFR